MDLFFREYGKENSKHLVILHGLYGSSDNWANIARKLAEDFHVIVPDLRNHGQSPHSEEHSYESMAEDIKELLDRFNIQTLYLAGHSMGGKLAMFFTANFPSMVERLIVLDISPGSTVNSDHPPENALFHMSLMKKLSEIKLEKVTNYAEADQLLKSVLPEDRLRGFILKNIRKTEDGLEWKFNLNALQNNLQEIMAGVSPEHFHEKKNPVPALFLRGEKSDYIRIEDFKLIRSAFPLSEIISIPDAGHWLHAEQPELILKNIRYFLKS